MTQIQIKTWSLGFRHHNNFLIQVTPSLHIFPSELKLLIANNLQLQPSVFLVNFFCDVAKLGPSTGRFSQFGLQAKYENINFKIFKFFLGVHIFNCVQKSGKFSHTFGWAIEIPKKQLILSLKIFNIAFWLFTASQNRLLKPRILKQIHHFCS